jgi:hypothetical protein
VRNPLFNPLILSIMLFFGIAISGCSNANKVHEIEKPLDNSQRLGNEEVGVRDNDMVVQNKSQLTEKLRQIREEVFNLEDDVLGNRKYGKQGLYGRLRKCKGLVKKDADRFDVKVPDRIADAEDAKSIGSNRKGALDENKKLVLLDEEGLGDQINRFQEQRKKLQKTEDEIREKLDLCSGEISHQ